MPKPGKSPESYFSAPKPDTSNVVNKGKAVPKMMAKKKGGKKK